MTGKTHIIGGLALCIAADSLWLGQNATPSYYAAGILGALLPDICHVHSKIGRRLPLLSSIISKVFGHRTITHSLFILAFIAFIFSIYSPNDVLVRNGLLIGMVSHIVLDAMTVRGVRLFYPLNWRIRFPFFIRTGGGIERMILFVLSIYVFVYSFDIFMKWL